MVTASFVCSSFVLIDELIVNSPTPVSYTHLEEAAKAIEPALTNPETANDQETWKLAGYFQKAI